MLSFAIPAHNEADFLPATLSSAHAAARALDLEYEIVVADDASTDATAEVARRHGAAVASIDRRQIAASRIAAARASTGDVLFFLDADTQIDARALEEALGALEAGAAGGGCTMRFDGEIPLYARLMLPVVLALFRVCRCSGGAAMFCTRAVYEATGGWDETLYASEELTFAKAIKRHGRFVVTRAPALTSGRKLRDHSPREIFGVLLTVMMRGRKAVQSRDALGLWYEQRKTEPPSA